MDLVDIGTSRQSQHQPYVVRWRSQERCREQNTGESFKSGKSTKQNVNGVAFDRLSELP